jgi:hypothetical protein
MYEMKARQDEELQLGPACFTFSQYCDGWFAHYEIWSIAEEASKVVDLKIRLDANEVQLQMQQSLWGDKTTTDEFVTACGDLKLQFPLSISPDVRSFAVLRTVYALDNASKTELRLHSFVLPMDTNDDLERNWTLRSNEDDTSDMKAPAKSYFNDWSTHDSLYEYLYWTCFSPDGNLLFWIDSEFAEPSTISVFTIHTNNKLSVSLLSSLSTHMIGFDEKNRGVSVSFHPSKPLLAFSLADTVFLWAFKNGMRHSSSPYRYAIDISYR